MLKLPSCHPLRPACSSSQHPAVAAAAAAFYSNHFAGLGNVPVAATPPPAHMGISSATHLDPKTGIPRGKNNRATHSHPVQVHVLAKPLFKTIDDA